MSIRNPLLVTGLLAGLAGAIGCDVCTPAGDSEPIELDVDTDLRAVAPIDDWVGDRKYRYLAAGERGTVLVWGHDYSGKHARLFVETSEIGEADLHGVWLAGPRYESTSWWAVGDAGTVATTDNHGATWNTSTLPVGGANLHAITGFADRPVIVGDEIVLVRIADGTWTEPSTPPGGWGQLRAVAVHDARIYAVGLGGRVWSASDPGGEWIAEASGVSVDLFDLGSSYHAPQTLVVVGAQGTVLLADSGSWTRPTTSVGVDLIDYDTGFALGANGWIYEVGSDGQLTAHEPVEGALALTRFPGLAVVGESGLATGPPPPGCE